METAHAELMAELKRFVRDSIRETESEAESQVLAGFWS